MNLAGLVYQRRRSLLTLLTLLIVAGVVAAFITPVSLFPRVPFPRIGVTIDAGDRPVDQMETAITGPVEAAVRSVPGVSDLRTVTGRGSAELAANFAWGSNMDLALQRVQAALARIQPDLPSGVSFDVRQLDINLYPVTAYSLTSARATPVELRRFAERVLSPQLSAIDGVARVEVQGGSAGEYRIEADPAKLWAHGLSLDDVSSAVSGANVVSAAGLLEDQGKLLLVLTDSSLTDLSQIAGIPIKAQDGALVKIGDVASVGAAPAPDWTKVTADGRPAVLVNVYQQAGGNTVRISKAVQAAVKRMSGQGPGDMQVKPWYDQSDLILDSASSLRNAIIIGVVLAALVLLVFLRDWKVTLVAVVTVPAVLAASALVLNLLGQSFNIMTLGGMAAAIGLIIDDAIVMIEHIERRLAERRENVRGAIELAASEFVRPLAASSAATIVIFLPLAFLTGVTGAFFKALSITMAIALVLSFLVAWWLVPVLVETLLKNRRQAAEVNPQGRMMRGYRRWLEGAVAAPWLAVLGVAAVVTIGGLGFVSAGSGFIPKIDEGGFILDYVAPPGMSLTETDRLLGQVEKIIRATPDVETYSRRTGLQLGGGLTEPNTGDYFIRLKKSGRRPIETVMDDIRGQAEASVPGLSFESMQLMEDVIGDLTAVPQPVEVKLYSDDAALLRKTAPDVADAIGKVRGITEVNDGVVVAGDGLDIHIDPAKAELEGVSPAEAAEQIQALLSGVVATQVQATGRLTDVRVAIPDAARARTSQVGALMLKSPDDGYLFPISRIASVDLVTGQTEVTRENLRRMDAVTARVVGRDTGSAAKEVQVAVAKMLPAGVTFEMGGLYAEQTAAFRDMALVFAAAVAAVSILLLLIYENFKIALSILMAPLAAACAVAIGLWVTGSELDIMALMGATMILGITTEVAIFYFSEYQALLKEGVAPGHALIEAGVNRLRPIAMTTLAAILALAPLALALGGGASMERPLAIAIIAGLIAQGPLVLLAMPAIFRLIGGVQAENS